MRSSVEPYKCHNNWMARHHSTGEFDNFALIILKELDPNKNNLSSLLIGYWVQMKQIVNLDKYLFTSIFFSFELIFNVIYLDSIHATLTYEVCHHTDYMWGGGD